MSYAKFNVWIRDQKCCGVIHRSFHLHVFSCCGKQVFSGVFKDGHAEFRMPPGCYIVRAGVYFPHQSNIYTDRAMVIVRCGEEACVNLILPKYVEPKPVPTEVTTANLIANVGCAPAVILALGVEALQKNIDPEEAFDVIMKTAEIDKKQMIAAIENDIQEISENIDEISKEERKDVEEYKMHLGKIKKMIGGNERC